MNVSIHPSNLSQFSYPSSAYPLSIHLTNYISGVYLFTQPPIHQTISLVTHSCIYPSATYWCIYPPIHPFIYTFIYLWAYLPVNPSTHLYIYPFTQLYSLHPCIFYPSIHPSIHMIMNMSTHLSYYWFNTHTFFYIFIHTFIHPYTPPIPHLCSPHWVPACTSLDIESSVLEDTSQRLEDQFEI